jgi:hypothetical protein
MMQRSTRPDSREQLIHLLTEAAELEHNILCSYLYAAFSLKKGADEGLSPEEAEAVSGWNRQILQVAIEEMGHLAIVNNLLVAVGGAPHFDRPNLPVPPGYLPACFSVRLTPFDRATLDHFIFLEHPSHEDISDHDAFQPDVDHVRAAADARLTPSADDYDTIAELYDMVRAGLHTLVRRRGSAAFIRDSEARQLGPDLVDLPGLRTIADLPSAIAALDVIVEQGEGASRESQDSHFARFTAIRAEWTRLSEANPDFAPAHPAAHDPVMRRPSDPDGRVWIRDPEALKRLDLANAIYAQVLNLLTEVYGPGHSTEERKALCGAAMDLMHALSALGRDLARLPASPEHPSINAGLTFTVPRNLGSRGRASAQVLRERLDELATAAADQLGWGTDTPLAQGQRRIAAMG